MARRPVVGISACLEQAACRYDGAMIRDPFIRRLARHVEFRTVCPEVEMGLGVPRDPIRLVASGASVTLVQPSTGRKLTTAARRVAKAALDRLGDLDGFILKARSPSCGPGSVKVFASAAAAAPRRKGRGLFADAVLRRHPGIPVEDEARLAIASVRKRFLVRLFARVGRDVPAGYFVSTLGGASRR